MIESQEPVFQRCSWHPPKLPALCNCGRVKIKLLEIARIVKGYPSVLCYPLMLLALLLGLGIWGVTRVVQADVDAAQVRAASLARDTAAWYVQQLSLALTPLTVMSAIVRYKPHHQEARNLFLPLADSLLAEATSIPTISLQLVPHGVIMDTYPLKGNEAALGIDLFAAASDRDGAVKTVRDGVATLFGPVGFFQGGYGVIVRQPIFVEASNPNETFGISVPVNQFCGAPCAYNATTGTVFWGFASAVVSLDTVWDPKSRLAALRDQGYAYQLLAPNVTTGKMSVVAGETRHLLGSETVEVPVLLPNCEWMLRVLPLSGWRPGWRAGMMAAVVLISVAVAMLTFLLLVSRRQHQMLLNALLPKDIIRELKRETTTANNNSSRGLTRILEAATPADMLLGMLGQLLEGRTPDLRDVVFIRTALMRNMDVYSPLNLRSHIKSANLDADVVSALMQQLGGGTEVARSGPSLGPTYPDDDEFTEVCSGGACTMAVQRLPDDYNAYDTPCAALQLVLGLQPPVRDGGSSVQFFGDTSTDLMSAVYGPQWGVSSSGMALSGPHVAKEVDRGGLASLGSGTSAMFSNTMAPVVTVPASGSTPTGGGGAAAAVAMTATPITPAMMMMTAAVAATAVPPATLVTLPTGTMSAASAASLHGEGSERGYVSVSIAGGCAIGGGGGGGGCNVGAAGGKGVTVAAGRVRRLSIVNSSLGVNSRQSPSLPQVMIASSIIEESERLLAGADRWQFDTWALQEATQGHALSALGFYLIQKAGLIKAFRFKPVTLARALRRVEAGYLDNPYHNAVHAADVLQTLHVIIHASQLHVNYLDHLGLLAAYHAAIVHDFGHPGLTNDFLVATSDPLAIGYNDRSPLENHHCAASFGVLQRSELDFLAPLSKPERSAFRKMVIELVLATDMKQHFSILSHFNTVHRLAAYSQQQQQQQQYHQPPQQPQPSQPSQQSQRQQSITSGSVLAASGNLVRSMTYRRNTSTVAGQGDAKVAPSSLARLSPLPLMAMQPSPPKPVDETERLLSLQVALKAADIGHLGEELEVHKRWLGVLEEEFFRQGDRERELGLPISPLFDRAKQGVSKSQVGFYDFVALPLVHALSSAFPGAQQLMKCFVRNYNHWRQVDGQPPVEVPIGRNVPSGRGSLQAGTNGSANFTASIPLSTVSPPTAAAAVAPAATQTVGTTRISESGLENLLLTVPDNALEFNENDANV